MSDRAGAAGESRGSGDQGGVGTGAGTGIGEGKGPGIGEGDGGGTGGGPFRPGSGIEPPSIRHEVKPDHEFKMEPGIANIHATAGGTLLARDRNGEIRAPFDGLVLARRARRQAMKQWSFNPATRKGVPVDVLVEVAMEFGCGD
jgi:hypothetical protein